jgi:hypothetical protein
MRQIMKKIISFLSFHNAVPLAAVVLTMGAGITFAATNPEAILSAQEKVIAIDNTYIASLDLDAYTPQAQVTAVTEDTDNYYVAYSFSTVALEDSTWRDVTKSEILTISKTELGLSQDLGVYVTQQLKEKIDQEIAYLKKVQEFERKSVTQKQIATAYGGLIGKLLDSKTETLPGYSPVVEAPELQVEPAATAAVSEPDVVPPPVPVAPAETSVVAPPPATSSPVGETATSTDAVSSATSTPESNATSTPAQSSEPATDMPESAATSTDQTSPPIEENTATSSPQPSESTSTSGAVSATTESNSASTPASN